MDSIMNLLMKVHYMLAFVYFILITSCSSKSLVPNDFEEFKYYKVMTCKVIAIDKTFTLYASDKVLKGYLESQEDGYVEGEVIFQEGLFDFNSKKYSLWETVPGQSEFENTNIYYKNGKKNQPCIRLNL